MRLLRYGDSAILVQFEQEISEAVRVQVIALARAIEAANWAAVRFCIPAYCSLTIGFNAQLSSFEELCAAIQHLDWEVTAATEGRLIQIPVCYEGDFAPDLAAITQQTDLSKDTIIQLHTNTIFRVYMLGFLPGFAYLGKLPDALVCTRKAKPRLQVPAGAVGLAGQQTGIYPSVAPGGWQLIGQTPLSVFEATRATPFLFAVGDRVQFYAIDRTEYEQIKTTA